MDNTTGKEILFEESIKYLEFIKEIIGKDRLLREFNTISSKENEIRDCYPNSKNKLSFLDYHKQFHPLFYLLYKVENQLVICAKKGLFTVSEDFIRLSYLGENLLLLNELKVSGLENKIRDLMSSNHELFAKTGYEIEVAANHARLGYQIDFIPTNSQNCRQSVDLLINSSIEIECKKKDHHSREDDRNIEYCKLIMRKTFDMMNYFGHNYSIIVKAQKNPKIEDIKFITENIRELVRDKKEGTFEFHDKGIDIVLQRLLPKDQQIESNGIGGNMSEPLDYMVPYMEIYRTNDGKTFIRNRRFFGFKTAELPDRIKSIIYSIKQALQQLSGERPALVYVDLNGIVKNMTERDQERLHHLINDILRNNSAISMIILTAEFSGGNEKGMYRYRKVWPFKNEHMKHKLPELYQVK